MAPACYIESLSVCGQSPTRPRPLCPPPDPPSPRPGLSEAGSRCVHSHSAVLQTAGSARAGCRPVQAKTLPLGSWVAAWLQVTLLRAAGPVPRGPSHCRWAAGSPPGQAQTKVTAPAAAAGSTAQEGCPSGGSGGKWARMGLHQATRPRRQPLGPEASWQVTWGEGGEQARPTPLRAWLVRKRLSSRVKGQGLGAVKLQGLPWKPQQEVSPCPFATLAWHVSHCLTLPLSVPQLSPGTMDNHLEGVSARWGRGGEGLSLSLPFPRFVSLSPCSAAPVGPPDQPPPNICPSPMGVCSLQEHGVGWGGGGAPTHSRC